MYIHKAALFSHLFPAGGQLSRYHVFLGGELAACFPPLLYQADVVNLERKITRFA